MNTTSTIYTPRTTNTATQQRILACVVETIATAGYSQASIGAISERLGISKGVVQYHFSTKEQLLQETIAYIYTTARDYMSAEIWNTTNEWEQISSFIRVSCRFYQKYPTHIQALQAIRANFQPIKHRSLAQTLYEQELSDLAKVFVSGQTKGIFRAFDPDIAALTLRFALNSVTANLYQQQDYDIEKHAWELTELFRHAFCKGPDSP